MPQSQVRFIHSVDDIGSLEVLLDSEVIYTIQPGELSEPVYFDPGRRRISLRSAGAQSSLTSQTIDFELQGYLVAFTGRISNASLSMLTVDNIPPEVKANTAAAEVVNLYEGQYTFDVYAGTTKVGSSLDYESVTNFTEVPTGRAILRVFNAGDDPSSALPIATYEHTFNEGEALMILLQNSSLGGVTITLVTVR